MTLEIMYFQEWNLFLSEVQVYISLILCLRAKTETLPNQTVNFSLEMEYAKYVSGKNIFYSINKDKIREERIFEIVHCRFEGRAKLHHLYQPNGPVGWC